MKYIVVQPPIAITNIAGDRLPDERGEPAEVSFKDFVLARLVDAKFTDGLQGMEAALLVFETRNRVLAEFERKDDVLALEDEQYKRLAKSVAEPTGGYNPQIQHNLPPFLLAVRDASSTDPRKVEE